jgi:hypothetical protein
MQLPLKDLEAEPVLCRTLFQEDFIMKNLGKFAVLGVALAVSATYSHATTITDTSTTLATAGTSTGVSTSGNLVDPVTNGFIASFTETVYTGGTVASGEAFCSTCLNFVFTVKNTATSGSDFVDQIATSNFGSFLVNLGDVTGTSVGGAVIDNNATDLSGIIDINIGNTGTGTGLLNAGDTLDTFILYTNAQSYTVGDISFQDGSSIAGSDLIPSIPEPNSLMLLGTGLVGAAGMLFRRRATV